MARRTACVNNPAGFLSGQAGWTELQFAADTQTRRQDDASDEGRKDHQDSGIAIFVALGAGSSWSRWHASRATDT
jgi:hypothetical protein